MDTDGSPLTCSPAIQQFLRNTESEGFSYFLKEWIGPILLAVGSFQYKNIQRGGHLLDGDILYLFVMIPLLSVLSANITFITCNCWKNNKDNYISIKISAIQNTWILCNSWECCSDLMAVFVDAYNIVRLVFQSDKLTFKWSCLISMLIWHISRIKTYSNMSNSLCIMKDTEALSHLDKCINFRQPYKLVVVQHPFQNGKIGNGEGGRGERGWSNPPQRLWDRLASPSGVVNMAESCQPACTKTDWSHMSRRDKNERKSKDSDSVVQHHVRTERSYEQCRSSCVVVVQTSFKIRHFKKNGTTKCKLSAFFLYKGHQTLTLSFFE